MPGWLIAIIVVASWALCSVLVALIKVFICKDYSDDDDDAMLIFFAPITLIFFAIALPISALRDFPTWLIKIAKEREQAKKVAKKRTTFEDYDKFLKGK